jgi:hypothetical protein
MTWLIGYESEPYPPGCRTDDSDNRIIVELRSSSWGSCLIPFRRALISRMSREVVFFIRRQMEMCSSTTLTLCHSWSVFVWALLSSLSRTVRRQSSIASLKAVTARITRIGTAPRPGFVELKIENIYINNDSKGESILVILQWRESKCWQHYEVEARGFSERM